MERFLHPGCFSIASVYAPISFRPLPLIAMKKTGDSDSLVVAAVGSLSSVDPDRINLKRIILTGYILLHSPIMYLYEFFLNHLVL